MLDPSMEEIVDLIPVESNNVEGRYSPGVRAAKKDSRKRRDMEALSMDVSAMRIELAAQNVENLFLMRVMNLQKGDARSRNYCNICATTGHSGETECPDVRKFQSLTRAATDGKMVPEALVASKTREWIKVRRRTTLAAKTSTRDLNKRRRQNRDEVQAGEMGTSDYEDATEREIFSQP